MSLIGMKQEPLLHLYYSALFIPFWVETIETWKMDEYLKKNTYPHSPKGLSKKGKILREIDP